MMRVDSIDFGQRFGDGVPFKVGLFPVLRPRRFFPFTGLSMSGTKGVLVLSESIRFLTGWQKAPKPGKMASARIA